MKILTITLATEHSKYTCLAPKLTNNFGQVKHIATHSLELKFRLLAWQQTGYAAQATPLYTASVL